MDRFESSKFSRQYRKYLSIYIPIWIDLKEIAQLCKTLFNLNLHSNMDRFERVTSCRNCRE